MNLPHHHPPPPPPPPPHSSSVTSFQTFRLLTTLFLVLVVSQFFLSTVSAIDCFKCVSVNGENPACEDPFHNNFTSDLLESPCLGGRKGRNGLFPATACLKLAGRYADGNYEKMVIRTCALDSGTLTLDTELVRMSHCGSFVLDGRRYGRNDCRGCALDSGTTTIDTEIIRMSHCGGLYFDDRYVNGCLQSCDDGDGCNSAPSDRPGWLRIVTAAASVITISLIWANVMPSYHVFR